MQVCTSKVLLFSILCLSLFSCSRNKDGVNARGAGPAQSAAPAADENNFQTWKLADGNEFSCWTSKGSKAGKPLWVWCSLTTGPVHYRINSGSKKGQWKEMAKMDYTHDGRTVADPNGQFGARDSLDAGKYSIEFKVGDEEFSELSLEVKQ